MKIWNHAGKTDPTFTKKQTHGAKLTSINPTYQIEKATELWGEYGNGWGARLVSVDYITYIKPATKYNPAIPNLTKAVAQYEFFWADATMPIAVDWAVDDDDFMIKMETKAISKSLARLGFNNDIFKGQFDDQAYYSERLEISEEAKQIESSMKIKHKNKVNEAKTKLKNLVEKIENKEEKKNASDMMWKAFSDGALSIENFNEDKYKGMEKTISTILKKELQKKADDVKNNKKKIAEKIIKEGEKK